MVQRITTSQLQSRAHMRKDADRCKKLMAVDSEAGREDGGGEEED